MKARTFLMLFLTWDSAIALAAFGGIIAETLQEGAPDAGVQVLFQALIASIFAILLVVFGSWAIRSRERRGGYRAHYRLVRFAAANGMTYLPGPMSDGRFGSARRYFDLTRVMRPTLAPGVEFGNHEIVTAGRRQGAPRFGGYAMVRLAHEMPHIRVIARRGLVRRALTMMSRPDREQRLSLGATSTATSRSTARPAASATPSTCSRPTSSPCSSTGCAASTSRSSATGCCSRRSTTS